jgi:hypothetical protein
MPEPKPISFVPKWFRNKQADDSDDIPVAFGSIPDQAPRIVTRLVPKDHGCTLTARTLGKVIELKQSLVLYAARDVIDGYNPDFADLRTLKEAMLKFATLSVEPFESGSFVIAARLEAAPLFSDEAGRPRATEAIVQRFNAVLAAVDKPNEASSISIGALLTCKELARLLYRDVETIEWSCYDRENNRLPSADLAPAKVHRIEQLLQRRRPSQQTLEPVQGRLTALDTVTNAFQLTVPGQKQRVKGTVMAFHMPWMRERLGQMVELEGLVERRNKRMISLTVHRVNEGDDE